MFPPCYLTWGQTVVEVMKIMVTSFRRSHAGFATLRAPSLAAGHRRPTLSPETPGHSRAALVSLLLGHCSFLLGPGEHRFCLCPPRVCFPSPFPVSSGGSVVGLMATSSKRAYSLPRSTASRAPAPAAVHYWPVPPQEIVKHNSVSVSVRSLCPGTHKVCLSPLSISGRCGVWF